MGCEQLDHFDIDKEVCILNDKFKVLDTLMEGLEALEANEILLTESHETNPTIVVDYLSKQSIELVEGVGNESFGEAVRKVTGSIVMGIHSAFTAILDFIAKIFKYIFGIQDKVTYKIGFIHKDFSDTELPGPKTRNFIQKAGLFYGTPEQIEKDKKTRTNNDGYLKALEYGKPIKWIDISKLKRGISNESLVGFNDTIGLSHLASEFYLALESMVKKVPKWINDKYLNGLLEQFENTKEVFEGKLDKDKADESWKKFKTNMSTSASLGGLASTDLNGKTITIKDSPNSRDRDDFNPRMMPVTGKIREKPVYVHATVANDLKKSLEEMKRTNDIKVVEIDSKAVKKLDDKLEEMLGLFKIKYNLSRYEKTRLVELKNQVKFLKDLTVHYGQVVAYNRTGMLEVLDYLSDYVKTVRPKYKT